MSLSEYYQGTNQTEVLRIPRTSSVPTVSDVTDATLTYSQRKVVRMSKAFGQMTVTEDSSYVYVTVDIAPSDNQDLVGAYDRKWTAEIDGVNDVRASSSLTILYSEPT